MRGALTDGHGVTSIVNDGTLVIAVPYIYVFSSSSHERRFPCGRGEGAREGDGMIRREEVGKSTTVKRKIFARV